MLTNWRSWKEVSYRDQWKETESRFKHSQVFLGMQAFSFRMERSREFPPLFSIQCVTQYKALDVDELNMLGKLLLSSAPCFPGRCGVFRNSLKWAEFLSLDSSRFVATVSCCASEVKKLKPSKLTCHLSRIYREHCAFEYLRVLCRYRRNWIIWSCQLILFYLVCSGIKAFRLHLLCFRVVLKTYTNTSTTS